MLDPGIAILALLLCAAAGWDMWRRRIPNAITVALAATGIVAQFLVRGPAGALSGLAAGMIAGAALFPAWAAGKLGGGDLKLAAAAAIWVGLSRLLPFALASALAAGLLAFVCYAASSREARAAMRANLIHTAFRLPIAPPLRTGGGRVSIPAGVAVAAGALFEAFTGG